MSASEDLFVSTYDFKKIGKALADQEKALSAIAVTLDSFNKDAEVFVEFQTQFIQVSDALKKLQTHVNEQANIWRASLEKVIHFQEAEFPNVIKVTQQSIKKLDVYCAWQNTSLDQQKELFNQFLQDLQQSNVGGLEAKISQMIDVSKNTNQQLAALVVKLDKQAKTAHQALVSATIEELSTTLDAHESRIQKRLSVHNVQIKQHLTQLQDNQAQQQHNPQLVDSIEATLQTQQRQIQILSYDIKQQQQTVLFMSIFICILLVVAWAF